MELIEFQKIHSIYTISKQQSCWGDSAYFVYGKDGNQLSEDCYEASEASEWLENYTLDKKEVNMLTKALYQIETQGNESIQQVKIKDEGWAFVTKSISNEIQNLYSKEDFKFHSMDQEIINIMDFCDVNNEDLHQSNKSEQR